MLNLIKNEFVKIFAKKSSYVMIIAILVFAFALQFLPKLVNNNYYYRYYGKEQLERDLSWYKETNSDHNNDYVISLIETALELEIYDLFYYDGSQSWQAAYLSNTYELYYYNAYSEESEADETTRQQAVNAIDACTKAIKSGDYKPYYETLKVYYADSNSELCNKMIGWLLEHDVVPENSDWRYMLVINNLGNAITVSNYETNKRELDDAYDNAKAKYEICMYRLNNNIQYSVTQLPHRELNENTYTAVKYIYDTPFWSSVDGSSGLLTIMCVIMIIIAGGIIAGEFGQGTIKFLLINPVSRARIFWAKYASVIILMILTSIFTFLSNVIATAFAGNAGITAPLLNYANESIHTGSVLSVVVTTYAFALVEFIVVITIAFMISALFRSTAVSIGISLFVMFIGSTATELFAVLKLDYGRYLVFANWDILGIKYGNGLFPHMTVTGAVITIIIYMVLFLFIARDAFVRKEV